MISCIFTLTESLSSMITVTSSILNGFSGSWSFFILHKSIRVAFLAIFLTDPGGGLTGAGSGFPSGPSKVPSAAWLKIAVVLILPKFDSDELTDCV